MRDEHNRNRRNDGIGISFWANLPISAKALSIAALFGGGASVSSHLLDFLPGTPGSQDCVIETAGYAAELDELRGVVAVQKRRLLRYEDRIQETEEWAKETVSSLPPLQQKKAQDNAPVELLKIFASEGLP